MTRREAADLTVGDRIVWDSPSPRARLAAGTIVGRGSTSLTIGWDDADYYPVYDLDDCAFLTRAS
ncbi:MAG: hypothetical protein GEV06_09330 [Luteitalea sp.]|nr:hypothetical protein [Luteitalea sp.]